MKKALILAAVFCLGLAVNGMAEEEYPEIYIEPQIETIALGDADLAAATDELFAEYVDKCFLESVEDVQAAAADNAGRYLEGNDRLAYERLKDHFAEVAAGNETSTIVTISLEEMGIKRTYTSEDLGGPIIVDGGFSDEAVNTALALVRDQEPNMSKVVHALMADCPYELYWFDKSTGYSVYPFTSYGANNSSGEWVLSLNGDLEMEFSVASEYAAAGEEFMVDPTTGTAVQNAAANAAGIVEESSGLSDRAKLTAYKDAICARVSYNYDAASGGAVYGNPWQLIWVFDDDPSTKVVCEGYAKAFQYLYEMSHFSAIDTKCILVSGTMSGGTGAGGHMWNIVTLDGKKYVVDVTNCDEGTIGDPDKLFLQFPEYGTDPNTGYGFQCYTGNDGIVTYVYDSDMFSIYTEADLTLSLSGQGTLAAPGQTFDGVVILSDDPYFNFSFSPVTNADSYQLVIRDAANEPEIISETDFDAAGNYTYSSISFNPGKALEAGKFYKMAVGALSTSYGAGWPSASDYASVAVVSEDQILTLPADLTMIDEEAFSGTDAQMVIVPEGTETIGAYAFSNCPNLIAVKIPGTVTDIDPTAFSGCNGNLVVIRD